METTYGINSGMWSMFQDAEPAKTSKLYILDAFITIKNFWIMFPMIISEADALERCKG